MNGHNRKEFLKKKCSPWRPQEALRFNVSFFSVCWISLVLSGLFLSFASGVPVAAELPGPGNVNSHGVALGDLNGDGFQISTNRGPYVGGNTIMITNGILGSGTDITNVTVCGVQVTILAQGTNWVSV